MLVAQTVFILQLEINMKYAHYDEQTGKVKGFYADDIHETIPTPNIELTEEAWQAALGKQLRVVNSQLEEMQPTSPTYAELRAAEYPPIGDQLDALWKGGSAAEEMLATVMAVKAKYPKLEAK